MDSERIPRSELWDHLPVLRTQAGASEYKDKLFLTLDSLQLAAGKIKHKRQNIGHEK